MNCPGCQIELQKPRAFCPNCGEKLTNLSSRIENINSESSINDILSYSMKACWSNLLSCIIVVIISFAFLIAASLTINLMLTFFGIPVESGSSYTSFIISPMANSIPESFYTFFIVMLGVICFNSYNAGEKFQVKKIFQKLRLPQNKLALNYLIILNLIYSFFSAGGINYFRKIYIINQNNLMNLLQFNYVVAGLVAFVVSIIFYYALYFGLIHMIYDETKNYMEALAFGANLFLKNFLFIIGFGLVFLFFSFFVVLFTLGIGIFFIMPVAQVATVCMYHKFRGGGYNEYRL
ncbi:MAG: hypothetical protein ACQESP_10965 [Candidatus Muiribacteriota bacterium]